jgi:hypothetical protein
MASVASRKVIRRKLNFAENFRWFTEIEPPTSAAKARYIALVGGAMVERALEEAIHFRFGKLSKKQFEGIFAETGLLGSFSAKITIAQAMKILGNETKSDLNCVKDIRNIFAHAQRPLTFRTKRIVELCHSLKIPGRYPPDDPAHKRDPYGKFRVTLNMLIFDLSKRPMPGRGWTPLP